jgi:DNA repair protein RecO (recombination protein O)
MPTYSVNAINVGSFNLGEADKIITLFSSERGLIRAVAKGARKPGAKIGGRADILAVNKMLLAQGRSLDIITQTEGVETFKTIRTDLTRLAYAFYYAELTTHLGQGLNQESDTYFEMLINALRQLSDLNKDPIYLCLNFQLSLLQLLGLKPELDSCVICRKRLVEYDLSIFDHDLGGAVCNSCFSENAAERRGQKYKMRLAEAQSSYKYRDDEYKEQVFSYFTYLTPLVWKKLLLAAYSPEQIPVYTHNEPAKLMEKTFLAARNEFIRAHLSETNNLTLNRCASVT